MKKYIPLIAIFTLICITLNSAKPVRTHARTTKSKKNKQPPYKNISFDTIKIDVNQPVENTRFVFIVPSYNNANWVERNLVSIFSQNYKNYHILYIDDASTDNSVACVKACVAKYNMQDKITLIENKTRQGMMANRYNAIHKHCNDNDVCMMVDGDDWLIPDTELLSFYNKIYSDPHVWVTYGKYVEYPSGKIHSADNFSQAVIKSNTFRYDKESRGSHLRTFMHGYSR